MAAVLLAASDATTGIMSDLVPFAADQEIEMKINGDSMSGIAEEYVSVRACSQMTTPTYVSVGRRACFIMPELPQPAHTLLAVGHSEGKLPTAFSLHMH